METPYSRIGWFSETQDQEFLGERYGDPETLADYRALISRFCQDLATPPDTAIAYSGGSVERILGTSEPDSLNKHVSHWAAEAFPDQYVRIDQTPLGRFVFSRIYDPTSNGFLSKDDTKQVERELSAQFASHAAGAVVAMVDQAHPNGVFLEEELLRFLENQAVTSINGVSTRELVELAHRSDEQGRDWMSAVFRRIEPSCLMTHIYTPGPELEEDQLKHDRGLSVGR